MIRQRTTGAIFAQRIRKPTAWLLAAAAARDSVHRA
jgi:hypothetical protein